MTAPWTLDDLALIGRAEELEISAGAPDPAPGVAEPAPGAEEPAPNAAPRGSWLPIWAVCVGDDVFVRTWHRRSTGWFGRVLASGRASIRVPGLERDVTVDDLGLDCSPAAAELRSAVDDAYQAKYARYGDATVGRMTSDEAASTTLRLTPR